MVKAQSVIPFERIASRVYLLRGQKVMFDADLAEFYGVETKQLNQAVSRNSDRFPEDFMFRLTDQELQQWRSQIVTSNPAAKMSLRRSPYVFTELGIAMLSSVLRSKQALGINMAIMRTFVKLRQILASNKDLARKVQEHDRQIGLLFETVQKLLEPPPLPKKRPIGFIAPDDE